MVAVISLTAVLFYLTTSGKFNTVSKQNGQVGDNSSPIDNNGDSGKTDSDTEPDPGKINSDPDEGGASSGAGNSGTDGLEMQKRYEELKTLLDDPYMKLVNRTNLLSSDFIPSNLTYVNEYRLEGTAAAALKKMLSAAKKDGFSNFILYSGYRKYSSQKNKYDSRTQSYVDKGYSLNDAKAKAGEYIAPPGASEHQSGLAADVCIPSIVNKYGNLNEAFDQTKEYKWLRDNAHKYGFILRYPKGKESVTGYSYEPWHYRYVGVEQAEIINSKGVTFEEYHASLQKELGELKTKLQL